MIDVGRRAGGEAAVLAGRSHRRRIEAALAAAALAAAAPAPAQTPSADASNVELKVDESLPATFGDNAPRDQDGGYQDHSLALAAGQTVQIDMMSNEFDPMLEVLDTAGVRKAIDDDDGEGLNARLRFRAESAAAYVVRARASGPQIGRYNLAVSSLDTTGPLPPIPPYSESDPPQSLGSRPALASGNPYAVYGLEGQAGERVSISMDAYTDNLDPRLELSPQSDPMAVAANDDVDRDNNARLLVDLPHAGTYIVRAIGLSQGEYKIRLERLATVAAPIVELDSANAADGLLTVDNQLELSDPAAEPPGSPITGFVKLFRLPVRENERVTAVLAARSADFTPLLEVGAETPAGFAIALSSAALAAASSGGELSFTARATAPVLLRVRSLNNETGAFTLSIRFAPTGSN